MTMPSREKLIATLRAGKVSVWNRWAELSLGDLSLANLSEANLSGAKLSLADLSEANLSRADLSRADLSRADLSRADLSGADLSRADLSLANLSGAELSLANLSLANLSEANLSGAKLSLAKLSRADLSRADLSLANLSEANLSGAIGLLSASAWMRKQFAFDEGYIVYRAEHGLKINPLAWVFRPGATLTEVANPDRCTECGCGVSFATLEWVKSNHPGQTIWRCRIEPQDLPGIIVPYNTDGKARCERLVLIEIVEE